MTTEAKLEKGSRLELADIMWLLAGQIRESRQVSEAMLAWFQSQSQTSNDFTEKQLHRLSELRGSIESAIIRSEERIIKQLGRPEPVRFGYVVCQATNK